MFTEFTLKQLNMFLKVCLKLEKELATLAQEAFCIIQILLLNVREVVKRQVKKLNGIVTRVLHNKDTLMMIHDI